MGRRLLLLLITMIMPFAHADQPWSTSVDGRLFKGGTTTPLRDQMLVFTLQILNPARTCVLYEESQTYDTDVTNGFFNLKVGSRAPDPTLKRTSNDPGFAMARIFNNTLNSFPSASNCPGGYTPADGDSRYLRVIVRPSAGGVETLSPDIALNSVPSAKVAETVGGLERSQILNVNMQGVNRVDMTNLESIFNSTQLPILNSLLAGTSGLYIQHAANNTISVPGVSGNASGASAGQIWYDTTSNQLKYQSNSGPQTLGVAGAGISSVTAGTGLNVGAGPGGSITSSGTLNVNVGTGDGQIVQVQTGGKLPVLDGSNLTHLNGPSIEGNISITGTINSGAITSSGNIAGVNLTATNSVTANDARLNALRVYKPSTTNYVEFVADAALSAPVVFTLPTALGTNGQVLQTDNAGKLSWISISNVPGGAAGGDLGGSYPNPSVHAVRGNPVATGTLAVGDTGKVYRWSGTQFEAVNFGVDDLRTEAGLQQFATNCGADQTLTWSTITDAFACTTIGIAGTQITSGTINSARLPTIDPTKGGTGLTALGTSNQVLGVNNAGSAMEYKSITGGAGVTITHSAGGIQVSATGSGGTVTNVTGAAPISVTNNNSTPAITISQANTSTDGYLSSTDWNTFNNKQAAGNYLTGLTGDVVATGPGSVASTIQANAITTGKINNLAVTDAKINDVAWAKITGVPALLAAVNTAGTSNQVFGMNAAGSAGEYKSITGGSGVTITHSANGIEVSATGSGGTVTAVTAGTGLNVGAGPGGTINGSGTLNIDVGTTTGKIVQVAAGNKLPVIDGSNLTGLTASQISSGTLTIAQGGTGQTSANAALNALLPSQSSNAGKVLQTNGTDTSWVTPNAGTVTNVTATAPLSVSTGSSTPALSISQANTSTPGYLSAADWNTFNNKAATADLNNYVLKAGDTMTGALTLPSNGLVVGTDQLVVSGAKVGIGTASPGGLLHVLSSSDPSAKIESSGASSTLDITSTTNRTLRFRQSAGTIAQITNAGASIFLDYNGANNGGRFGVRNGIGGTETLTLLSSGSLGVGTTSPQGRLHIAGGAANTTALMTAGAGYNAGFSFGDTANGTRWKVEKNNTTEGGSNAGSDLVVSSWDDAGAYLAIPFMIKRSNGNVGINTQTPGEKLEVVGKIKGTELCIGTDCRSSWPTGAGGTVTSVTSANADIGVATTTTTPVLTLNSGTGANQIVKLNGSSELPAVSGVNLTNLNASNLASGTVPAARLPAFTGDVTSSAGSATLTLGTVPVAKGGTGSTSFGANKLVSTNGTGSALVDWFCPDGQFVKFTAGVVGCDTLTNILGYAPANGANYVAKAGDTMTGTLNLPSNGLAVGTNQLVVSGGSVGVGTTANSSAALDVSSTTKGFLPPRMTTAQRNAVSSPAAGLTVYNSDTKRIEFYDGTQWSYASSNHYVRAAGSGLNQSGAGLVNFTTRPSDPLSEFNLTSDRFTPTAAGKYLVVVRLTGENITDGGHLIAIVLKNNAVIDSQMIRTSVYNSIDSSVTSIIEMNGTTDYIDVQYNISSGNISAAQFIAYPLNSTGSAGGGGADNLGNHTASQNIILGGNWISGDGSNKGIRIDNSGNVGIGKAPTAPLDVVGDVKSSTAFYAPSSYFDHTYTNSQSAAAPGFSFVYSNDTGMFEAGSAGSHTLGFSTAGSERMRILSGGNVGIGLNNPSEKLEVSGKVKATELCIGADCRAAWPTGAGGTVTSVTSANADISVATTTTTPVITLNTGTGANQIVKLDGSGVLPTVSGANLTNLNAGSISTGTLPIARGGTGATSFNGNKLVATDGTGSSLIHFSCAAGEMVKFDGSGVLGCATIASVLGYTPANGSNYVLKSGDTMTGSLTVGGTVTADGLTATSSGAPLALLTKSTTAGFGSVYIRDGQNQPIFEASPIGNRTNYSWVRIDGGTDTTMPHIGSFASSTNPGLALGVASANNMVIAPSGNVGIGTSSPVEKLSVEGSGTVYTSLKDSSGTPVTLAQVANSTNGYGGLYTASNHPLYFGVNNVVSIPSMMISTAGRVGIGTTNPTANLHVEAASSPGLRVKQTAGSDFYVTSGTGTSMGTASNTPLDIRTNNTTRLTIDAAGNVGIGASLPAVTLDLSSRTDALRLPAGTTAQRPGSSANGDLRYNSTSSQMEAYVGGTWTSLLTTGQSRGFSVYNTTFAGLGTVVWGGVHYNDGNYNAANGRYTASTSGLYYLCTGGIPTAVGTVARWYIQVNGVNKSTECRAGGVSSEYGSCGICTTAFMNAGDYASVNVTADGIYQSYGAFSGVMISGSTIASGGSGTTNYIPQWTSSTALGNSPIAVSGSNVGIGTASPATPLDVNGSSTLRGTVNLGSASGANIAGDASNAYVRGVSGVAIQNAAATATYSYLGTSGNNTFFNVAGGNVGIGTNNPTQKLHVYGTARIDAIMGGEINGAGNFHMDARGGGATYFNWSSGSGGVYVMNGAMGYGSIYAGAFTVNSDRTLKKNIEPLKNSLDAVNQMNGVKFNWISPKESADRQVGVIAQDVQKVLPELVSTNKETGRLAVNYPGLVAPLIEAVKELYKKWMDDSAALHAKVEEQQKQIDQMRQQNEALLKRLEKLEKARKPASK